jgi:hypothetical protein
MKTNNDNQNLNYNEFLKKCFPDSKEIHIRIVVPKSYNAYEIYQELILEATRFCRSYVDNQ